MMNLIFQLKKKRKVQSFLFNLIIVNPIMLEYLPLSTNRVKKIGAEVLLFISYSTNCQ